MIPSRTILLKRRKSGNSGPPSTLKNGELAFNEVDKTLYYGSGSDENDNAVEIITIAGNHTNILKDASIVTSNNTPQPTNQYLVINVNGTQKAIRLYDL
jgi:hypothetical protein